MMTLGWPWPILFQGQIWSLRLFNGKKWKMWIFSAHLSTKCSWWAIVTSLCLSSCVVRRASVRLASCVNLWTWLVNTLEATVLVQSSSNLLRMIILTISRSNSNMGHVGSKTRSVGQLKEKQCEHSRGHSFSPIIIKLAQNDHLDNTLVKFEHGLCRVKNKVSRSNHRKTLWTL